MLTRCAWVTADPLYIRYHDEEWGQPCYEDQRLFEMLVLEGMQAGLSWITILRKRDNFREAFDNFSAATIARYDEAKMQQLLTNPGIIRNRRKITATIENAKQFLTVQQEHGSFSNFIWQFLGGSPKINHWQQSSEVPVTTAESTAMSQALQKRGFHFVGSTICYAFMQAVGMVNDHTADCFLHKQ